MMFVVNGNWWTLKFDNFSYFQNVISNNPNTRERHYGALRTNIDMWLTPKNNVNESRKSFSLRISSGHILDLFCVRLSKAVPFCENYTKFYFDAKHLEKGLNRGRVKFLGPFFLKKCRFHRKCPFWPILNATLNF